MKKSIILSALFLLAQLTFGQNEKPPQRTSNFSINGGLSMGGYFYEASGTTDRQAPYGYSINANTTLRWKNFSIPFSVVLNEQGRRFEQPFNRFGLSPTWRWGKVHLGHRNLRMSKFILAGQTMYMAGVELTPGKLRFAAIRGRLNEAAGVDDPNFLRPRFQRNATVLKLGRGDDRSHFDFVFMKGKDDLNSLNSEPDSIRDATLAQENSLFGIKWRQPFIKGKLIFDFDAAASTFTEDIRYEPIDFSEEVPSIHRIRFIIRPNGSTHFSYAGETSLRWQSRSFGMAAIYRRVMPEYEAMGVNYLLTDVEALTLNPSFTLWQGKVVLGGSLGRERNNLDEHRLDNTERAIGSVDLNISPVPQFGIYAQYSNYTIQQQVFRDELSNDSLLIDQINRNLTVSPRFSIFKPNGTHTILATLNYQILDDQNQATEQFADNDLLNAFLNYVISMPSTGWNIRAGLNYFRFDAELFGNERLGTSIGLSKNFGDTGLTLSTNGAVSSIRQKGKEDGMNYSLNTKANYAFSKKSSISFQLFFLKNDLPERSFSETRGQLRYNYRF